MPVEFPFFASLTKEMRTAFQIMDYKGTDPDGNPATGDLTFLKDGWWTSGVRPGKDQYLLL